MEIFHRQMEEMSELEMETSKYCSFALKSPAPLFFHSDTVSQFYLSLPLLLLIISGQQSSLRQQPSPFLFKEHTLL